MTPRRIAATFAVFLGLLFNLYGQAFQNLDFEATPIYAGPDPYNPLGGAYGIPGWTVSLNNITTTVWSNDYVLGATAAALIVGSNNGVGQVVDGNQSIFLAASSYGVPVGGSSTASLSQTGIVPRTAKMMEFKLGSIIGSGGGVSTNFPQNYFHLTVAGQAVPLRLLTNTVSFAVLGADVSQWAGQSVQLTIGVLVRYQSNHTETLFSGIIDDVAFVSGQPNLSISNSANSIVISWPNTGNYVLQQRNNLAASNGWTTSAYPITTNTDNTSRITVPAPHTGNLFFRLVTP
jgi:hypothetical protein